MNWLYATIWFLSLLAIAIWMSMRYAKREQKINELDGALKRAKKAKDIDGSGLDDKWLRPRD